MKVTVKGTTVTMTFDVSGTGTLSASGKSMVLASTRGNKTLADLTDGKAPAEVADVSVGLNVYRRA